MSDTGPGAPVETGGHKQCGLSGGEVISSAKNKSHVGTCLTSEGKRHTGQGCAGPHLLSGGRGRHITGQACEMPRARALAAPRRGREAAGNGDRECGATMTPRSGFLDRKGLSHRLIQGSSPQAQGSQGLG